MAGLELQIETGGEPAGSCLTALAGFLLRAPHAPWSPLGRTRSKQVGRPVPWLSGSLQLHNHHQSGQGGLRSELVTIRLGGQDGSQELAHSALLCGRSNGGLSHDRGDS